MHFDPDLTANPGDEEGAALIAETVLPQDR